MNGVNYITSAAASGAWWAGDWVGDPPGYTVFTCRNDQLTWQHVTYPWVPHLEEADSLERKRTTEYQAEQEEQQRLLALERAGRPAG